MSSATPGAPPPVASVVCHGHGHDHAQRHCFTAREVELLLEWFSGHDWDGGPRCLHDILVFIQEENAVAPPLALR